MSGKQANTRLERIVSLIFLYKSKADKSNEAILPGCFTKTFCAAYTTCHKLLFAIMLRLLIWKQMNELLDGVTEGFIGMQHARRPYYVANTEWLLRGCPFTSNFTSLIHILIETLLKGGVSKEIKITMEHLFHGSVWQRDRTRAGTRSDVRAGICTRDSEDNAELICQSLPAPFIIRLMQREKK